VRRLGLIACLLAAAACLAGPAAAWAKSGEVGPERAIEEVRLSRAGVDRAVEAAQRGQRERAYEEARSAYLDHFELAEIPLRLRDPNLVLDTEFLFAELRNGVREGEPVAETRATARKLRASLDEVERTLADPGFAAPLLAFVFSFSILFREGVEAVLLIAVLIGSLEAGRAADFRRPLGWGVLAALVATALTWVLATLVIDIAPLDRELLEAVTALLAVVVLVAISFWLVARLEHRRWMEFMRARVSSAVAAGSGLAFAGLGFTAVYREGFETVLFYQALVLFAEGLLAYVALGAGAAVVVLAAVGWAVLRAGRRLPLKPMLLAGASVLLLLSVAFAGNAVRSLQEGDWVAITPIEGEWARLPVLLAELTGIHPTLQGILTQAAMLAIFAAGALYMFAWLPLRRRRAAEAAPA
jgi:high-affinity iron transporter